MKTTTGKKIRCEECQTVFLKTNKSNRCPECRKIQLKYSYQLKGTFAEQREKDRIAREKNLMDATMIANKRGISYGQLQAEKIKKKVKTHKVPEGYTSYTERRKQMKATEEKITTAKASEPVIHKAPEEPKAIPICVKAMVSARIAEIRKELAELEAYQASYSL